MRVHIGGKISRFSLLNMTITEAKKKLWGKLAFMGYPHVRGEL